MKTTTVFTQALGNSPVIRILDFLIEGRDLDYSLTDIAENAHVSWSTLHRVWNNLIQTKMVKPTREIGRAKLFKLNQENPAVKKLIILYDTLLYQATQENMEEMTIQVK